VSSGVIVTVDQAVMSQPHQALPSLTQRNLQQNSQNNSSVRSRNQNQPWLVNLSSGPGTQSKGMLIMLYWPVLITVISRRHELVSVVIPVTVRPQVAVSQRDHYLAEHHREPVRTLQAAHRLVSVTRRGNLMSPSLQPLAVRYQLCHRERDNRA